MNIKFENNKNLQKTITKSCLICASVFTILLFIYIIITQHKTIKKQENALVSIKTAFDSIEYENIETKYDFIDKRKAVYIEQLSIENDVKPDLSFSFLMKENGKFDEYAVNQDNLNGTVDVGLFQLNDYYAWTDFVPRYWKFDVPFNPFNWKHNTYIAIHHIAWLQKNLKVEDDVIMAYNCGLNAVINDKIPTSTREDYLVDVKKNMEFLKNYNNKMENKYEKN